MKALKLIAHSETETRKIAKCCAQALKPGAILCLIGDLGAGKTTFVKGMAAGLNIKVDQICSPTYVLMNLYEDGKLPLYHFDLYRLGETQEIGALGYEEFLYGDGISVVEWADRFGSLMPQEKLLITIKHVNEQTRNLTLKACGKRYEEMLLKIESKVQA